ncbi:prephenate dehydrogenase/arogenate dehydrogenase family protein, partial [Oceanicola sp. S124]|uniref:prephenate dehydrogenase/arogenate dehydrogenase family protein n=1 Tax=Oceanicola sp. S124 TaxID=1042378 RepID=UPI00025581FA
MIYPRIALIGLGLIASSIIRAAERGQLAGEIRGYDLSDEARATAREIALGDVICDSAEEAVADADLVILAVPVGAMGAVAERIAPHLKPGAVLSDVGSVKGSVVATVGPHVPEGVHFIPAHPLAGTEHSGPRAGFAELFDNRWCLIVPAGETDPQALEGLKAFW